MLLLGLASESLLVGEAMFLAGINVTESAFHVTESLTPSWRVRSLIECAGHFMLTKKKGTLSVDANAFSFNNETKQCKLGTVSFPVEEQAEDRIFVYGKRKLLYAYFV